MATVKTKKKPGKPSDFQGKHLEFLLTFYPTYADASQRGKTRGIWTEFFKSYWAAFPWRLPLTQDPNANDPTDYALKPQNPDEEALQTTTISSTEQKIKLWLGRQSKAASMKENPWGEWLRRFRTPSTSAPKRLADYQYYMQQKPYKDLITAEFETRKVDVPGTQLMNLRATIARELLAKEPQEVRDEIHQGAVDEHAELLARHQDALDGLPALDEEGLEEARTRFSALIQPLLDGLAVHTGYEVSILAGRVKKNEGKLDIECVSLHAGVSSITPPALDFSKADPRVYADVMRSFSKFVWNANEFRLGRATSTPDPAIPATGDAPTTTPPIAERGASSADGTAAAPQIVTTPPAQVAPSNAMPESLTTDHMASAPAAMPSDTFSDAEIRAHLGLPADFDEFDFPPDLMPGLAVNPLVLNGFEPVEPSMPEFAAPLGAELKLQLDSMVGEARLMRMAELQKLDASALERENNSVRNRYMLNALGLGDAEKETLWGGSKADASAPKRKAPKDDGREDGKRRRKRKDPVLESEEEEPEEDDEEGKGSEEEEGGNSDKSSQATSASIEILRTAQAFLTQAEYGDTWGTLLAVWWKREERVGFVGTGNKSHPAKKRPKEVGDWVGRARNHKPKIANAESFGETWWACERPMSRDVGAEAGWDPLDLYGHNGFLNVLMALKWWRDAMSDASPNWEDAVNDVTWALSSMERAVLDGKRPSPPTTPPPTGIQPPTRTSGQPNPNPEIPGNILDRDSQSEGDKRRSVGGLELSQEELDEMEADAEADMAEEE
ncbi:hypothetical protein R3P38DRAFT_3305269 [Favolaschia claudopus]|uniref:Uncharacterized protein n=1 Tax=Favolaschia claudopus TaxID=2862362 RepID=A0AAW0DTH0_9AGAR